MKKFLSLFLAIVMTLSVFSCLTVVAGAATTDLVVDTEYTVASGTTKIFIPEKTGYYKFESNGTNDPMITLYQNDEQIGYSDDYSDRNFRLIKYLEAGSEISCYLEDYSGEGDVVFTITEAIAPVAMYHNITEPLEIVENTCGEWADNEIYNEETDDWEIVSYYEYYLPESFFESAIIVEYGDGSSKIFNYDESEGYISDDGEYLSLGLDENQSANNPWVVGGEYALTLYMEDFGDVAMDVPVRIVASPYESAVLNLSEPIVITEETSGCWEEREIWNEETEDYTYEEFYRYYTPEIGEEGNSITINYTDGLSDVYSWNEDEWNFVNSDGDALYYDNNCYDTQYSNHWKVGSENYFILDLYDFGLEIQVQVTIEENPYESIEFTLAEPIEIIENTNGEMSEYSYWDDETEEDVWVEYFYYDTPSGLWNEGNTITVNYKDDSSDVYTCDDCGDYVNDDGEILDWDYSTNQSYDSQWTLGSNNYITIECYGKETRVPVTIVENPYKSIEFTLAEPIEVIENTNGEISEDSYWDDETEDYVWVEYFRYDIPSKLWYEGNTITVNYKDGSSVVYTCDDCGDYVNHDGEILDWDYRDNQSYYNLWTLGSDNYITIECYGKETQVPVTIVENPYKSISFAFAEPVEFVEEVDGYWTSTRIWNEETEEYDYVEWFCYNTPDMHTEGNTITVNYKDGSSEVYTCDGWDYVNAAGDILDWDYRDNQSYYNPWTLGSDNYIIITCFGKECQAPVTIVESPYDSIEFIPAEPITVEQYTNGYWNSYYNDETGEEETYFEYEVYDLIRGAGNIINIVLKDGSKIAYICDGHNYYNSDKESLSLGYSTNCENWSVGGGNIITVETMGFSFDIDVTLIENSSVIYDNTFVAEKVSDDTCIITGINVSYDFDGVLDIPETVNGCTVIGIEDGVLSDVYSLTEVNLPSTFNMISENLFRYCNNLEAINVAEDNSVFASVNGILYNKALTEILCIPEAFCGDLVIKAGVTELSVDLVAALSNASSVEIENGNTAFAYEDGILYNADFTKIYKAFSTDADYVMKETVVEIADYSFQGNETLESVVFAPGVTDITYASFEGCSALETVELPEALVSIGARAFAYNSALSSITLPSTTKTVDDGAFRDCGSLAEINLNEGLVKIGDDAFSYAAIDSIVLPNSLTTMGEWCFAYCENLSDVTIGSGLTTISPYTFYGCYALEGVDIPENVTVIDYAFSNTGLKSIVLHDKMTSIEGAFSRTQLTSIPDIPKSITSIDDTFSGCEGITVANIPNHIVSMNSAFSYCYNLEEANIPNSVVYMDYAFAGCRKLTDITIPNSVVSIGGAFSDCSGLTEVEVPDSVVAMNSAFSGCYNLGTAYVGKGVESMDSAFYGCYSLEKIELAEGINCSGDFAFSWCRNLTDINIPSSVTELSYYQFRGCESLDTLDIPETLYKVEAHALDYTGWHEGQADGPTYLEHVLYDYKGSMPANYSLVVKAGTTSIAESAFLFRSNLVSVELPDGFKYIGKYAFDACPGLKSITIPGSVEYIGDYSLGYAYDDGDNTVKYDDFIIYGFSGSVAEKYADENGFEFISIGEAVHTHTPSDWIIDKPATCSAAGSKHKECTDATCKEVLETATITATGHTAVKLPAVAATCTTAGKTEGSQCSVCKTVLKAQTTVAAKGHTAVKLPAVAATCTAAGKTEGSQCSVCKTVIKAQTTVKAKGHTVVKLPAVAATCTAAGKTEGSQCSVCKAVIKAQTTVAMKSHTPSNWITDKKATASAAGSMHKECTVCKKVLETKAIAQLNPATPKTSSANAVGGVNVTWNKVDGAVKYVVFRRAAGSKTWVNIGTTTALSLLDKNVKSGTYYCYSVRAYNSVGGYSAFNQSMTSTRKYMASPKLTTIYNHVNGLAIKWNAVAGVTNGYRVYRRGAGSTYWTYLGTTKNTYWIDFGVKNANGGYYRYTVIADGGYHSAFDTTGLYLKRLANPALNSATKGNGGITVKWGAIKGTTGYYVYRKTANSGWQRIAAVGGTNNTTFVDRTAKAGTTYTYTVRACYGYTLSSYNSGISCKR